jgi:hypothetical protein
MAGHSHFSPANVEEHFEFSSEGKKRIIYGFIAGIVALIIGTYFQKVSQVDMRSLLLGMKLPKQDMRQQMLDMKLLDIYREEPHLTNLLPRSITIGLIVSGLTFG